MPQQLETACGGPFGAGQDDPVLAGKKALARDGERKAGYGCQQHKRPEHRDEHEAPAVHPRGPIR